MLNKFLHTVSNNLKIALNVGRGQSARLYSNDPSSNPAEAHIFSVKFALEKKEERQKEAWVGPFKNK